MVSPPFIRVLNMLDSKSTNNLPWRNLAWGCLIFTFVLFNTKDFWTDFLPSLPEKTIQGDLENSQEYKDILDLQKAFVRNAKKIKPSVVSVNRVKELIEKSSWYDPHNHGSETWYTTVSYTHLTLTTNREV